MKVVGYLFNKVWNEYSVYISNGKDNYFRFPIRSIDELYEMDHSRSMVRFYDHDHALREIIKTLSDEVAIKKFSDLLFHEPNV